MASLAAACASANAGSANDSSDPSPSASSDGTGATPGGPTATSDAGGGGPTGSGTDSGSAPAATGCEATGDAHAVGIVMTQRGGKLIDNGLKFTGISLPSRVAMRSDGKEAIVAWGDVGKPYGVAMFSLAPDGSTASLVKSVTLGTGRVPEGIDYVTDDRVMFAVSASDKHEVVTLDRKTGLFAETTRAPAPGNFPLEVRRRPGHPEAIMPRTEFGVDKATFVHLMSPNASNAFVSLGTVGNVTPQSIDIGVHPSGNLVYSPTENPADQITPTKLTTTTLVNVFPVSESGLAKPSTVTIPRAASLVAVDPNGKFLVFEGADYSIDPKTQTPVVHQYALITTPLDAAGNIGTPLPESALFPALLFWDMVVSPTGHLLVAENMWQGTVPPDQETPLELRAQTAPGQWTVCQTLYLPAGAKVAVAP
jgi:hypothetical protein